MISKVYINEMNEIHASEELIQKTIKCIKDVKKFEKNRKIKKVIAGATAALTLSIGSVAAYIAITGNTEILQKIGIKLSQNYEQNEQIITAENSNQNKFFAKGFEATLKSASMDNASIVMEIDLKLNDDVSIEKPDLKVKKLSIYKPSVDRTFANFELTESSSVQKMEDGTYKLFKYIAIKDPSLASNNFFKDIFYQDSSINCTVIFSGIVDENGNEIISAENLNDECNFYFELTNPGNLDSTDNIVKANQCINYKNVEISVDSIQKSNFGNIITINAVEKNIDINKINDIQKIDFIVKDSEGNSINIVSRTQNVGLGNYSKGTYQDVYLEDIQLIVDDYSDVMDYTIEIIESSNLIITTNELIKINNECVKGLSDGTCVYTTDGQVYPRAFVDESDYYMDDWGVYICNKSSNEIIEEKNKLK